MSMKRLSFYQCPSDDRVLANPFIKDYFGVTGGKTATVSNGYGDVFLDGLFVMQRWGRFADITDGTSNTFAVGESVHNALWGLAVPGYRSYLGGPTAWWNGCWCSLPNCDPGTMAMGRGLRSTKYPINTNLFAQTSGMLLDQEADAPFGSFHSGGAYFLYADGHVDFINETIDMKTYQNLSTFAGGEIIDMNAMYASQTGGGLTPSPTPTPTPPTSPAPPTSPMPISPMPPVSPVHP